MYYFLFTNERIDSQKGSYKFGECVSRHKAYSAAHNRGTKVNKLHDGIASVCEIIESDDPDAYEIGRCYVKLIKSILDERVENWYVSLMVQVLESERDGVDVPETTKRHIAETDMTLPEYRERYEAKARQHMEDILIREQEQAAQKARINAISSDMADMRSEITYTFPAVRGIQSGKEFYTAQVPYRYLVKLFVFDDEDVVPPELRAQRNLNVSRAKKIGEYMLSNPDSYVIPSITASVSAEMKFEPYAVPGSADRLGLLHIPMDAVFLINDGQHRRSGIEFCIRENPKMQDETVCVTIYYDHGLEHSQQMFADINSNQVKPASSINALYNLRCPFNAFVQDLLDKMPEIKSRIEMEASSVGQKSLKLWSLVAFRKFITQLTGLTANNYNELINSDSDRDTLQEMIIQFVNGLAHIPNWTGMLKGTLPAVDIRSDMVISHAVFLEALGIVGRHLLQGANSESIAWKRLEILSKLDPAKSSKMWQDRCVVLGKMQKTSDGVKSTAAQICRVLGMTLSPDLESIDSRIRSSQAA